MKKSVSVVFELETIQKGVEGAAALVALQAAGGLEDEDALGAAEAILALIACRLRDLRRVVSGALDTKLFLAAHNVGLEAGARGDAHDVLLRGGDEEDRAKKPRTR
jgi:hypothetical protein